MSVTRPEVAELLTRLGHDPQQVSRVTIDAQDVNVEYRHPIVATPTTVPEADRPSDRSILMVEDVATWIGISPNTLRYWRATDKGPKSMKLGRRIAYRREDVECWLNEQVGPMA